MDTSRNYKFMARFYYNNPHQYKSLTDILKHMVKYIT